MKIRNVKLGDLNFFVKLYFEAYKGLEKYAYGSKRRVKRYFRWLLSRDPNGFFLAELNEPIAFIACDTNWFSPFEARVVGEIHELFVHPKYREQGIGRMLINRALEYARSRNRKLAGLWVGVENYYAKKFYRKLGFKETITIGDWTRMIRKI